MPVLPRGWDGPEPPERVVAELERRLQHEVRAEQEVYEELAALDGLRVRRLADVALELLMRGDRVTVTLAAGAVTGTLAYAAGDLATLDTAGGAIDLNLGAPLSLRVAERARDGGRSRAVGPRSFKACLCEHEAAATRLAFWTRPVDAAPAGVIAAVAVDHLAIDAAGSRHYLALSALDAVGPA